MSKQAAYHQTSKASITLDVLKDNKDGTLDLGRDGSVIIASCPVSEETEDGHCTPLLSEKAEKAAAEKTAADKVAAEKAK